MTVDAENKFLHSRLTMQKVWIEETVGEIIDMKKRGALSAEDADKLIKSLKRDNIGLLGSYERLNREAADETKGR